MRTGLQKWQKRAAKDLSRHDATSEMDLVHQLNASPRVPASGSPLIIMVQPTHDRTSNHLVPCILTARNRSTLFRDLLPNPLMGPCPVEVSHIGIEHPLELLFLKN
jgi:hypothetical protein